MQVLHEGESADDIMKSYLTYLNYDTQIMTGLISKINKDTVLPFLSNAVLFVCLPPSSLLLLLMEVLTTLGAMVPCCCSVG